MTAVPRVGLAEIDRLILAAADRHYTFPAGVKRWQLLSWAAECIDAKRTDEQVFNRSDFERITEAHFPGSTKRPPA